jgi:tRNA modification GTPase
MSFGETVVAIATPPGEGAIGIVRLTGPDVCSVGERIFHGQRGRPFKEMVPYRLTLGYLRNPESSEEIDEVLAVFMPSPRSYTGEDMAEFQAHGGRAILEKILQAAILSGARPAKPGEFTRRAFLNGRLDLAQAEAVIDLIRSRTGSAHREALRQLKGVLSEKTKEIRSSLTEVSAAMEALLDFSEDDAIPEVAAYPLLDEARRSVGELLDSAVGGRMVREGLHAIVTGRANVGKSSIINALLGAERSIVTPHPGTTRDVVEGILSCGGLEIVISDTAGLGTARDPAEEEGIRRSRQTLERSDLAAVVIDSSEPLQETDREILRETAARPSIVVLNKIDLSPVADRTEVSALAGGRTVLQTSAKKGSGIDALRRQFGRALEDSLSPHGTEGPLVTNTRHLDLLRRVRISLDRAAASLARRQPLELAATDIREALSTLGELTGDTATEEILDRIFSQFCIGK